MDETREGRRGEIGQQKEWAEARWAGMVAGRKRALVGPASNECAELGRPTGQGAGPCLDTPSGLGWLGHVADRAGLPCRGLSEHL